MKKFLIIGLLISSLKGGYCQELGSSTLKNDTIKKEHKNLNSVYVELLGPNFLYSLNYCRKIQIYKKIYTNISVGYENLFFQAKTYEGQIFSLKNEFEYVFNKKHSIFIGCYARIGFQEYETTREVMHYNYNHSVFWNMFYQGKAGPIVGYKKHFLKNKKMFYSVFFTITHDLGIADSFPWIGFKFGYKF